MTHDERSALLDVLCADCGGLLCLPEAPVPPGLLRWCLCAMEELLAAQSKEVMGFTKQASKSKKRKE